MINNKAQNILSEKTIVFILVVLVICVVLFFVFNNQIISYVKSLPGYSSPVSKDESVSGSDELADLTNFCPKKIGDLNGGVGEISVLGSANQDMSYIRADRIYAKEKKSFLYADKLWPDKEIEIGIFENGKTLLIYDDYLSGRNSFEGLPVGADLALINGSFYWKNRICKNE